MDRISGPRNAPIPQTPESTEADAAQSTDVQQSPHGSMGIAQAKDQLESPRAARRDLLQHMNTVTHPVGDDLQKLGSRGVTISHPVADHLKHLGSNTVTLPIADELRNLAAKGFTVTQPIADDLGKTVIQPIADDLKNLGSPELTISQPIADDLKNLGSTEFTVTLRTADDLKKLK